jgi:hypothetical protein
MRFINGGGSIFDVDPPSNPTQPDNNIFADEPFLDGYPARDDPAFSLYRNAQQHGAIGAGFPRRIGPILATTVLFDRRGVVMMPSDTLSEFMQDLRYGIAPDRQRHKALVPGARRRTFGIWAELTPAYRGMSGMCGR